MSDEIPDIDTTTKHWKLAYARTLYNIQGDDTASFYMAPEDIKWFTNPRMAYTLISRLRGTPCADRASRLTKDIGVLP
jgi:hypothetical protein